MLGLALAVRDKLTRSGVLSAWAQESGQLSPRVLIGYKQPRGAQDWPFVALLVVQEEIDLSQVHRLQVGLGMVLGVREHDPSQEGGRGLVFIDRLREKILAELRSGRGVQGEGWRAVARRVRLIDLELKLPHIEAEYLIEFEGRREL